MFIEAKANTRWVQRKGSRSRGRIEAGLGRLKAQLVK